MDINNTCLGHRIYNETKAARSQQGGSASSLAPRFIDTKLSQMSEPGGTLSRMNADDRSEVTRLVETSSIVSSALASITRIEHRDDLRATELTSVRDDKFIEDGKDSMGSDYPLQSLIENAIEATEIKVVTRLRGEDSDEVGSAYKQYATSLKAEVEAQIFTRIEEIETSSEAAATRTHLVADD